MIYEGHKNVYPLYERFNNVQYGFMKVLKMRISLFCVFQKFASRFMKVAKNASPLYERFNTVHHGFTKAFKNVHLLFMTLSKVCFTIYEGLNNLHPL